MNIKIRSANLGDVNWIAGSFWAEFGTETERGKRLAELESLISSGIAIVAEGEGSSGFLLARLVGAPPVYDPGGPVCFVEHLHVGGDWFGIGAHLIEEAAVRVKERGGVLLRVVCTQGDAPLEQFLAGAGFTIASEWYAGSTADVKPGPGAPGVIREAEHTDLPAILRMADENRDAYAVDQPVFWRKSQSPPETFAPYLGQVIADPRTTALIHEVDGAMDSYLIAAGDYVDDAAVMPAEAWATVGAALLREAANLAAAKGIVAFRIVCAHGDASKRETISEVGFTRMTNWWVRDLVEVSL